MFAGFVSMRARSKPPLANKLLENFAMGAVLGLAFSLALVIGDVGHVFGMITSESASKMMFLVLAGVFLSIFAVGATLTGLIFIKMEEN
jgi:hypothetical protein